MRWGSVWDKTWRIFRCCTSNSVSSRRNYSKRKIILKNILLLGFSKTSPLPCEKDFQTKHCAWPLRTLLAEFWRLHLRSRSLLKTNIRTIKTLRRCGYFIVLWKPISKVHSLMKSMLKCDILNLIKNTSTTRRLESSGQKRTSTGALL